jgi:hypothetical protein
VCLKWLELAVTGILTPNWACDWLWRYGWEVMDHLPTGLDLTSGDVHFFGPLKKHLALSRFSTDANMKQAITSWLQALDIVLSTPERKPPSYEVTVMV